VKRFRLSAAVWALYFAVLFILLSLNAGVWLAVYLPIGLYAFLCRDRRAFDRPEKRRTK
jgi:hypothetical protein